MSTEMVAFGVDGPILPAAGHFTEQHEYPDLRDLLAALEASTTIQRNLAALAKKDATKTHRDMLAAVEASTRMREQLANLDVTKTYRDILAATESGRRLPDNLTALAKLDVTKTYRDMLAALDASAAMRDQLAKLDVTKAYRDMLATFDASTALQEALANVGTARMFGEIVVGIEAEPGTEAALDEVTRRVNDATVEDRPLSNAVRLAIAIYVAVLAFTICVWFYVLNPAAATIILDASTPAAWALIIGKLVYQKLGPPPER